MDRPDIASVTIFSSYGPAFYPNINVSLQKHCFIDWSLNKFSLSLP